MAPTVWLPLSVTVQLAGVVAGTTGMQFAEKPPKEDVPDGVAVSVTVESKVK
jgi:hypothetical protein